MTSSEIRPVAPHVDFNKIPESIQHLRQWVMWRYEKGGSKWAKVPYHPNGYRAQASKSGTWSSFDDVYVADLIGGFDGVGFVFTEDDEYVGIDLDDCIDEQGNWSDTAKDIVSRVGSYCEVTPSGRGLHILVKAKIDRAKIDHYQGLEVYESGRYFTVTGNRVDGPEDIVEADLSQVIHDYFDSSRKPGTPEGDFIDGLSHYKPVVDYTDEQIRDTLQYLTPDAGYHAWLQVGMALHHQYSGLGPGLEMWDEWSKQSVDYNRKELESKWRSFSVDVTKDLVSFATVIKRAKEARKRVQIIPLADLYKPIPYSVTKLKPTEFVLDGFIGPGITAIAGEPAAGKSSGVISLACCVAHLAPKEWGLNPTIRRQVIYVTEDVDQLVTTLYAIRELGYYDVFEGARRESPSQEEFDQWFTIIPSTRSPVEDVSRLIEHIGKTHSSPLESCPSYTATPLIVMDTTNAILDVESEQDNSEIGRAIALIKEKLYGTHVWIVGHTPKATKGAADPNKLTMRGASAFEADVHSTAFFLKDEDAERRVMALGKRRFQASYDELHFRAQFGEEQVPTEWGALQTKKYLMSIPAIGSAASRQQEHDKARRERAFRAQRTLRNAIAHEIVTACDDGVLINRSELKKRIGFKSENVIRLLNQMIEDGNVEEYDPGEDRPSPQFKLALRVVSMPEGVQAPL